jgi:hypothetical protein
LTAERGLALSTRFVGDPLLFSQMISSKSEGLLKFLDYCANNLSTISNEASLAALSETSLKRRRSLGLNEIRRPKEEVQTLLKKAKNATYYIEKRLGLKDAKNSAPNTTLAH